MHVSNLQKHLSLCLLAAGASVANAAQQQQGETIKPQEPTPVEKPLRDAADQPISAPPLVSVLDAPHSQAPLNQLSLPSVSRDNSNQEPQVWDWVAREPYVSSVVKVKTSEGDGTGVLIKVDANKPLSGGFQAFVLTAAHVVAKQSTAGNFQRDSSGKVLPVGDIKIAYASGRGSKSCTVVNFDIENDLAVLSVWAPEGAAPAPLASAEVNPGDELIFVGLGGSVDISCCARVFRAEASKGSFTSEKQPGKVEQKIFADAFLIAGDSGGPVFNSKGEVCGTISGGWFWRQDPTDSNKSVTWPARAGGLRPIKKLLEAIEK